MTCSVIKGPQGQPIIVCQGRSRGRSFQRCYYCGEPASLLCDGLLDRIRFARKSGSKTCDRPLCTEHAHHIGGEDLDFCRGHERQAAGLGIQESLPGFE